MVRNPDVVKQWPRAANVTTPSDAKLRQMAEQIGHKTQWGNYAFFSVVRNRSAALTVVLGVDWEPWKGWSDKQKQLIQNAPATLKQLAAYLPKAPMIHVQRIMGKNPLFTPKCNLYISTQRKDAVRLPYMWSKSLFTGKKTKGPDLKLIYIPEWHEKDRQILVFPNQGLTYILGTDYYGEVKKGFLRMAMWYAKKAGMLAVHAGAKLIQARDQQGKMRQYSMVLFGLTATGKTTHSCHNHNLDRPGEKVSIVQDDVVFIRLDGSALGTEKGFFVKTDSLHPTEQPLLYKAATKEEAVFENVMIDSVGRVSFEDETLTGNGRGIIQRTDLGKACAKTVNLPPISKTDGLIIAFITRRNTVQPIASKLTPEQAAAFFMLGESIETAASDPTRAGKSVRVVGTNPFIVGCEAEEGNRFYEFIKANEDKIQCYLLNTGGIGEISRRNPDGTLKIIRPVTRIQVDEMASIIRGIVRDTIEWVKEPDFGTLIPKKVEGVRPNLFNLKQFYSADEREKLCRKLRLERIEYLEVFKKLRPIIKKVIYRQDSFPV